MCTFMRGARAMTARLVSFQSLESLFQLGPVPLVASTGWIVRRNLVSVWQRYGTYGTEDLL